MSYEAIDDGRTIRARKRRRCEWCGESIEVGEVCILRKYKFDGDFNNCRQHPECHDAMQKSDLGWEQSFEFGEQRRGKTMEESEAMRDAEWKTEQESPHA